MRVVGKTASINMATAGGKAARCARVVKASKSAHFGAATKSMRFSSPLRPRRRPVARETASHMSTIRALHAVCAFALVLAPSARAQSTGCASTNDAVQGVAREFWSAYNRRDLAALDRVLDDELLLIGNQGTTATKAEFLKAFRVPEGSFEPRSAEAMDDVRTIFAGNTALVSFNRRWMVTFKGVGVTNAVTARLTETLICRGGRWRVLAYQETVVPNATRSPNTAAVSRYDDYVGRYRFGGDGTGGEILVTRKDDKLFEAWGKDEPIELLPGKHDSFFARGFPWVERFVRDGRGRVVGIHYTLEDSEMEARRVP